MSQDDDDLTVFEPEPAGADGPATERFERPTTTEYAGGPLLRPKASDKDPWPVGAMFGSIRVLRLIAVGGMGEVFEAFDESLRRRVALKSLRRDQLGAKGRARLLREARVLSQLSDPRICAVYGWHQHANGDFLVLEMIEGSTLSGLHAEGLPRATLLRIACDIAEVLAASHRRGVIHRDLKPSNVMLTPGGQVKVLDFGISSVVAHEPGDDRGAVLDLGPLPEGDGTQSGIVGTLRYMSPEQARGERVTAASDMFSFGLLLEEIFTGRPPDRGGARMLAMLARQERPRTAPAGVAPELADLILRLTALAPEARPTAADVVDKLKAMLDAPRRRLRALAVAGAALALATAGVAYTYQLKEERNLALAAEQRAEAARRETEEVVAFLEGMFAGADPKRPDQPGDGTASGPNTGSVEAVFDRGVERIGGRLADQPAARARLLATLGQVATNLGQFQRADSLLTEALALREHLAGPDSAAVGDSLARLAFLRREQDRYEEALALFERALTISRLRSGDGGQTAQRLLEVATVHGFLGRHDEAEALIRESLALRERSGATPQELWMPLVALANAARRRGDFPGALALYERLSGIDPGQDVSLVAKGSLRYNHGVTLSQLGRFEEAEPILLEARELWGRAYRGEHPDVAKAELALATIDRKRENWDAAEKRYLGALAIWRRVNGPDSVNAAFGLNNLGNLYVEKKEEARALPLYLEALAIFEKRFGAEHGNVAMTHANLGRALVLQGRSREAVRHLEAAAAIDGQATPASADYGWDLAFLAWGLCEMGQGEAARTKAGEGLKILAAAGVPDDHSDLVELRKRCPAAFPPAPAP